MFNGKSIMQIALIASITLLVRGAFHFADSDETKSFKTKLAMTAGLDVPVVTPMTWKTKKQKPTDPRDHNALSAPFANLGRAATGNPFVAAPSSAIVTALAPATPGTKKKDEKKKTEKTAKAFDPQSIPNLNYAQTAAAASAKNAADAAARAAADLQGAGPAGPAPYRNSTNAVLGGGGVSTNSTKTTGLTAADVMGQLFPASFTQDGMRKLAAMRTSGQVTTDVYYQVLSNATTSTSPQSQSLGITALISAPSAEAFTLLAQMLEHTPTSTVQSQTTAALAQYQSTQMLSYLSTPLDSADATVRYQALVQISAAAATVSTQLGALQRTSSGATRTTASLSVQSFFNGVLLQIQTLQKTETNLQNQTAEASAVTQITSLLQIAKTVQASASRY